MPNTAVPDADQRLLPVDPGFAIQMAVAERVVKGEDISFVHRAHPDTIGRIMPKCDPATEPSSWKLNYDVFCVCDGHSGTAAANYVKEHLLKTLHPLMPVAVPPTFRNQSGAMYAQVVRNAISRTLFLLNKRFSALGVLSGCTCTVAIVTGALLTVANLGDSDAILDCFNDVHKMSVPHRVNDNLMERKRVKAAGSYMATISMNMTGAAAPGEPGMGPLRIWPGGLCVSRGVGDIDVGPVVIAKPHIRQVVVPTMGARLIIASDGVWDTIPPKVVSKACRKLAAEGAANSICERCLRAKQGFLIDDTTCIVVDFVPYGVQSFKGYDPQKYMSENSLSLNQHSSSASAPTWLGPVPPRPVVANRSLYTQPIAETTSSAAKPQAAQPTASGPTIQKSSVGSTTSTSEVALQVIEVPEAPGEASGHHQTIREGVKFAPDPSQNGATAPNDARPAPQPKPASKGFCGCFKPAVLDPEELPRPAAANAPLGAKNQSLELADTSTGTSTHTRATETDPSHHKDISVSNGSSKGRRKMFSMLSSSVHGGRLGAELLPKVVFFADVDMAYEDEDTSPLADAAVTSSGASSAKGALSPRVDHGLDMGFEPSGASPKETPLWHSMGPTTSDITTRPHRVLGPSPLLATTGPL